MWVPDPVPDYKLTRSHIYVGDSHNLNKKVPSSPHRLFHWLPPKAAASCLELIELKRVRAKCLTSKGKTKQLDSPAKSD